MLNEKILVNILKNNHESVIGFTDKELNEVLITDNVFILIIKISRLKQNGALMRLVNEAKLAVLSAENVGFEQTWCIKNKEFYNRKVTDYLKIFSNMEKLETEKAVLLPFSVKIFEETPISEEVLFVKDNNEYVSFNSDYFNIFKTLNKLRDGVLLKRCYIENASNKRKEGYSFLINHEDYKFLVMALKDVNALVLPFLETKK